MVPFSWFGSHLSLVCPVVMLVLPVHEIPPEARWVYVEVPDDFWARTALRHLTIRPCLDVVVLLLARGGMVFLFSLSCAKSAPALNHSVSNSVKVRRQRNEWKNRGLLELCSTLLSHAVAASSLEPARVGESGKCLRSRSSALRRFRTCVLPSVSQTSKSFKWCTLCHILPLACHVLWVAMK